MSDITINGVQYQIKEREVNGQKQRVYYNNDGQAFIDIAGNADRPKLEALVKVDGGGLKKASYKTKQRAAQDQTSDFINRIYQETRDENGTSGFKLSPNGFFYSDRGKTFALGFKYIDSNGKTYSNNSCKCTCQVDSKTNKPILEQRETMKTKTPNGETVEIIRTYAFPETMTKYKESKSEEDSTITSSYRPIFQEQEPKYIVNGKTMTQKEFQQYVKTQQAQKDADSAFSNMQTIPAERIKNGDFDSVQSTQVQIGDDLLPSVVYTKFDKQNGTASLETRKTVKYTPDYQVIAHTPVVKEFDEETFQQRYAQKNENTTYEIKFKDGTAPIVFNNEQEYMASEFYKSKPKELGI